MVEQIPLPITPSDFRLLGDFKSVVDLDTQVPHGRFQLRVTEKQLHGSEVPIELRGLEHALLGCCRLAPRQVRSAHAN